MPLATASQEVIPPKTFTNTLRTLGSDSTISRPFAITSADAPSDGGGKIIDLMEALKASLAATKPDAAAKAS